MKSSHDFASANRSIKENAYYMKKSSETENAKDCLRYANAMLLQLKNDSLSPKDYYILFQTVFDELSWLQLNFFSSIKKKKQRSLYEVVQYANQIIPRLYLMVTVGAFQMGSSHMPIVETMKDMLAMIKGVQHPCRGLFLRYFFLKIVKDKVEDNEQDLDLEGLTSVYVENLRQMNNLWIRMNSLIENKERRRKQRKDLAICVGENLLRLSNLESVDVVFYKEKLFPQLIDIILENKDRISQEYLFNILISAFPDDFHFETLHELLEATEKLSSRVDLNGIYLQLMQRFTTFAKNSEPGAKKGDMTFIYKYFLGTFQNIVKNAAKYKLATLFKLISGFMDFVVFFYDNNLEYINEIIRLAIQLAEGADKNAIIEQQEVLEAMVKILTTPFEKLALKVLKIQQFPVLLGYLPPSQKSEVALKICKAVANTATFLVTPSICKKFLLFVEPLFSSLEKDPEKIQALARVFHLVDSHSPQRLSEMLSLLNAELDSENELHLSILYPVLVSRYLFLLSKTARVKKYVQDLGGFDQLIGKTEEFKKLFSKDAGASYLEEDMIKSLGMSEESDLIIDETQVLGDCHLICSYIELKSPLTAFNLYFDLMIAFDCAIRSEDGKIID